MMDNMFVSLSFQLTHDLAKALTTIYLTSAQPVHPFSAVFCSASLIASFSTSKLGQTDRSVVFKCDNTACEIEEIEGNNLRHC